MNTTRIKFPYALTFRDGKLVPGRGDAGWTVSTFESRAVVLAFMAQYPQAALPCWHRFAPGGDL